MAGGNYESGKSIMYNVIKNGIDFQGKVNTEFETSKKRHCENSSKYLSKDNVHCTHPS